MSKLEAGANGGKSTGSDLAESHKNATRAIRHIPSLDGLRAASFLLVFMSHAGLGRTIPGGFGVTIFFFLSGFLITTLMRTEYDHHLSVNLGHFWLRRCLRILPPFYLILATAILVAFIYDPPGSLWPAAIAAQALHVSNYWIIYNGIQGLPVGGGTGVYWSLAVEEHFYLLFPFLYIGMRKLRLSGRQQAYLLWGMCALVLAWRCVLVMKLSATVERTYYASDTRIDSILYGCALAVWYNPTLDQWIPSEKRWKYLYLPLSATGLFASVLYRDGVFRETFRYSLQGIALAPMFIAAIRFPKWFPFFFLNLRPMVFLGTLSYSMYLVHYETLELLAIHQHAIPLLVQRIVAFGLSVAMAWIIYLYVEKPCANLRRRLTD